MKSLFYRFSQLSFGGGVLTFFGIVIILLLLLWNPGMIRFESPNLPLLKVYLDRSRSMYVYQKSLEQIKETINQHWEGVVSIETFANTLSERSYALSEWDDVRYWEKPTYFNSVAEQLEFADPEIKYLVISDFVWSDRTTLVEKDYIDYLYLPNFEKTTTIPTAAAIILNSEHYFEPDQFLTLNLLFYHRKKNTRMRYKVIGTTPHAKGKGKTKTKKIIEKEILISQYYQEVSEKIKLDGTSWVQIKLDYQLLDDVKPSAEIPSLLVKDSMNFFPHRKRLPITFLYFKPTKDGLAIKQALSRYQFFEVDDQFLFKPERSKDELFNRLKRLTEKEENRIFFLISPPEEVVRFFRKNKLSFFHFPDFYSTSAEPSSVFSVSSLDFSFPFINFLGDSIQSQEKWSSKVRYFNFQEKNIQKEFFSGKKVDSKKVNLYQGNLTNSFLFLVEKEFYVGIKGLRYLNEQFIVSPEESFLDVFMVRLVSYFKDQIYQDLDQHSFNFFLGNKVSGKKLIEKLPHLVTIQDGAIEYRISPEIKFAGSYPSQSSAQTQKPPYNYRINFKEYLPGASFQPESYPTLKSFEHLAESLDQKIKVDKIPVEIYLRDQELIYYLLLGLFTLFLFFNWSYFRWR